VELRFFSEEWLPKAPARGTTNGKSADDGDGGPPEWQAWMDKNFPDWIYASGKDDGARKWSAHTSLTQKYVREMMKKAGAL
jgi:hypothetical protein